MRKIIYLTFIILGGCSGCSKKETYTACTTTGIVDKVVWGYSRQNIKKLAYLTFIHDEQPYTFREDFSPLMKINVGDSVQIQYNCNNPKKAKYLMMKKEYDEEQQREVRVVRIGPATSRYPYHVVDKKPLFSGVQDYTENEMAVDSYLKKKLQEMNVQEHGKMNLHIMINPQGKVLESTVVDSDNRNLNRTVLNILMNMPSWTPAEHNGKKVNVSFPIVLEW